MKKSAASVIARIYMYIFLAWFRWGYFEEIKTCLNRDSSTISAIYFRKRQNGYITCCLIGFQRHKSSGDNQ